jgi:aspartate kinase
MNQAKSNKIIVSKFGGTSMGDANCIRRSAQVVHKRKARFVVVSATSGTTNQLISLGQMAQNQNWSETESLIKKISDRHLEIAKDLNLSAERLSSLQSTLDEMGSLAKGIYLLRDCSPRILDSLQSIGERLSSILMAQALERAEQSVKWLDAREFILTDDLFSKARPQINEIYERHQSIRKDLQQSTKNIYVTQGYIGATADRITTTLGRGGSDYSAALFAEALDADELEIWTDVTGIATTDPRLVPQARSINEISFKEAAELAVFGAKVLHPSTLLPAMRKNIPTFVGSSFDANTAGTWIRKEVTEAPLVRAMALRKNQVLVTVSTPEMLNAYGFLFQIFKIFNDNQVSIDAITTSEISVSMTLDEGTLQNKKLLAELSAIADVQIESHLSLIALIGNNINHTPGLAKKIFEAISNVNVRMICLGASKHNFCFLVNDEQGPEVIKKLHQTFIESEA